MSFASNWIEECNYANDSRVRARDRTQPIVVELAVDCETCGDKYQGRSYTEDTHTCHCPDCRGTGWVEEEHTLPTRWEVCDLCRGEGRHVDPSIDASGISAEDFRDDPDFREDYLSGAYDVPCNQCGGKRVIRLVDEEACDPKILDLYYKKAAEDAAFESMCAAERRMGA